MQVFPHQTATFKDGGNRRNTNKRSNEKHLSNQVALSRWSLSSETAHRPTLFNPKCMNSKEHVHKICKWLLIHRKSLAADCDLHFKATSISLERTYLQKVPRLAKLGEQSLTENKDRMRTAKLSRVNWTEIKRKRKTRREESPWVHFI